MTAFFKTVLASASLALLLASAVQAKDQVKDQSTTAPAAAAAPTALPAATPAKATTQPLDLNSASANDLATLPQIGAARSQAIVQARPYKRKDELVSKKVLSQAVYDGIKDSVIAKQSATK